MSFVIHVSTHLSAASPNLDATRAADALRDAVAGRPTHPPLPDRDDAEKRLVHLAAADLVVVSLLVPCFQVGLEIERARALGIPILFVVHGRTEYGTRGYMPQLQAFPLCEVAYAGEIPPLMITEDTLAPHALEERLENGLLLETVMKAREKRRRPRLSTQGFPEL